MIICLYIVIIKINYNYNWTELCDNIKIFGEFFPVFPVLTLTTFVYELQN